MSAGSDPESCVFCEIVAGRAPASVVYDDDCCLAIMTVPYAFSFDMVLLLPAWILALCFYFERAPGWQVALVGMIVANAWLIAGKYLPWTETAYWPVPWIVLLITWRMVSQRYAVVSSSPQE